jgi:hypothetical protein
MNTAPASFQAALLDPSTQAPLVLTADDSLTTTNAYYYGYVTGGLTDVHAAASGVTVSTGSPPVVSLDVSALQAGQPAELRFRLVDSLGPNNTSAMVTLESVQVLGGVSSVIPEPSTVPLVILGGLGIVAYRRRCQRLARRMPKTETE